MNDFTKDALKYLHGAIYERPNSVTPKMDEMRDKIQQLIDNYDLSCKHQHALVGHKMVDGNSVGLITCIKCMEIL